MRKGLLMALIALPMVLAAHRTGGYMMKHGEGMMEFPHLLMKAKRMFPDKAKALREVENRYMPAWVRQMAEVHIAMFQLKSSLSDEKATEKDIRSALGKLSKERSKLDKINGEAILKLREVLGAENFARLFAPMMNMEMGGPLLEIPRER